MRESTCTIVRVVFPGSFEDRTLVVWENECMVEHCFHVLPVGNLTQDVKATVETAFVVRGHEREYLTG